MTNAEKLVNEAVEIFDQIEKLQEALVDTIYKLRDLSIPEDSESEDTEEETQELSPKKKDKKKKDKKKKGKKKKEEKQEEESEGFEDVESLIKACRKLVDRHETDNTAILDLCATFGARNVRELTSDQWDEYFAQLSKGDE